MKTARRRVVCLGLGVFGGMLLNIAVINSFPFLAGALTDEWRVNPMRVGLVISLELLVYAGFAIGLSAPTLRLNPRRIGLLGCALFALGNLLATATETYAGLTVARSIAGLGGGIAAAAVGRAIAFSEVPARFLSYIGVPLSVAGAVVAVGAGMTVSRHGYDGGCVYLAAIGGLAAAFSTFLPANSVTSAIAEINPPRSICNRRGAALVLGASSLVFLGSGSVWNFAERIGLATGLAADRVTTAIGLTSLAGVGGALAAIAVAKLQREFLTTVAAAIVFGLSVCALALANSPMTYIVALGVLSFAFIFIAPFLVAVALRIDPSGGLAGAVPGAQMLAGALAPFVGGVLLMAGSFRALALLAVGTSALAVLCIALARRLAHPHSAEVSLNGFKS